VKLPLPTIVIRRREVSLNWFLTGSLFLVFLVLYAATMPKGPVMEGDVSEFEFIGKVFGTPHPTGYPLYVSLSGLFVRLVPLGSIAFRANLFSALCSVAALVVLFRTLILLDVGVGPGLVAVLILGTTSLFWSQALVAEVYPLNVLLVGSILYVFFRWLNSRRTGFVVVGVGLYALALGNHLSLICLLPALLLTLLFTRPTVLARPRIWGWIMLFILLGASQYLLVVMRATDRSTAFVYTGLPGWSELYHYLTGQQFWGSMFSKPWSVVLGDHLSHLLRLLLQEYAWSLPAVLLGLVLLARRREGLLILPAILAYLAFDLNYNINDIEQYYTVVFYLLSICLGLGLGVLWAIMQRRRLSHVVATLVLLALPIESAYANFPDLDGHREGSAEAGSTIADLDSIKMPSVVLSDSWSRSTLLWYLQFCSPQYAGELYVVHHVWPGEIAAYCISARAYSLPETRQTIPPGLPVYAFGKHFVRELQAQGLNFFRLSKELYYINEKSSLPADIAARHDLESGLLPLSRAIYVQGWLPQEWWGIWATDPIAVVQFPARPEAEADARILRITTCPWPEDPHPSPCRVSVNGQFVGRLELEGGPWEMRAYDFPLPRVVGAISVTLSFPDDSSVDGADGVRRYLPVKTIDLLTSQQAATNLSVEHARGRF
jgi:hypothetical protein